MVKKGSEAECHLLSSTDAVASVVSHDNRNELNHWFIFHDYLDKTLFAFSIETTIESSLLKCRHFKFAVDYD